MNVEIARLPEQSNIAIRAGFPQKRRSLHLAEDEVLPAPAPAIHPLRPSEVGIH
jgi:hypothetical protein